jgi:hypothetical protein
LTRAPIFYILLETAVEIHEKMTGTKFLHMLSQSHTNRSELATNQPHPFHVFTLREKFLLEFSDMNALGIHLVW